MRSNDCYADMVIAGRALATAAQCGGSTKILKRLRPHRQCLMQPFDAQNLSLSHRQFPCVVATWGEKCMVISGSFCGTKRVWHGVQRTMHEHRQTHPHLWWNHEIPCWLLNVGWRVIKLSQVHCCDSVRWDVQAGIKPKVQPARGTYMTCMYAHTVRPFMIKFRTIGWNSVRLNKLACMHACALVPGDTDACTHFWYFGMLCGPWLST